MSDPSDPNSPSDPKSQGKRRKKAASTVSPSPSSDNIENDEVSSESSAELSEPEDQNEDSDNNDSDPPQKKKSRAKSPKRAADQSNTPNEIDSQSQPRSRKTSSKTELKDEQDNALQNEEASTEIGSESDEPTSEVEAEITANEDSEIAASDDSVSLETLLEGSETQEPAEPSEDDLDLVDRYGPPSGTRTSQVVREHLRGLIEAILFVSTTPLSINDLIKAAAAQKNEVKEILEELRQFYQTRGFRLDEVAGGWVFRTNPAYAPFVRDMTDQKPVKLTRAQIETLAIVAYKQPITRPEIDDVRGTDSGPMLKLLLERDLVRMLGKKEEAGRPILYGTTPFFLEFFGLRSLRDLPTLREFTELTDESKKTYERKIGEAPEPGLEFLLGTQPTPEQTNTSDPDTTAEATAPQSSEGNEGNATDSTEAVTEAQGDDQPDAEAQSAPTEEPNAQTEPQEEPVEERVEERVDEPADGPVDEPLTDADEHTQRFEGNGEPESLEPVENVESEHSEFAVASEHDGEIVEPIDATPSDTTSESPGDWAPDEQVDVANESIPTSVESSRESSSESQGDLPTEPISGSATDHENESETESEINSETELESQSETKSESENKPESETESVSETEGESEGDSEAETTQHDVETEPSVDPADESPLVDEESDSEKAEQETRDSTVDEPEQELDVLEVVVEHASFETVLAEMAAELDPLGKNKGEDNKG